MSLYPDPRGLRGAAVAEPVRFVIAGALGTDTVIVEWPDGRRESFDVSEFEARFRVLYVLPPADAAPSPAAVDVGEG